MKPPTELQAATQIVERLADLLSCAPSEIALEHSHAASHFDFAISAAGHRFVAEYKSNASTGSVVAALDGLKRVDLDAGIPLIVVPFMGPVGKKLCDRFPVSWLDLCGNAKIVVPGLRIWIEGRPNKYVERGRPPNVFASKSSRIARQLLLHPQRFQSQADLARQTELGDGYVSKIVRRLGQEHYIEVNDARELRPRDPNVLLDAWHEVYDFDRHRIVKGHVPARSGSELLQRVTKEIIHEKLDWAVTALSAAWLYTNFAAFRIATIYMSSVPSHSALRRMEFLDEPKGANLWIVLPDDEGVFQGSQIQEGIRCVSAVQTYLDLKAHPERAKDAATELRRQLLNW